MLPEAEVGHLQESLQKALRDWKSHGRPIPWTMRLYYNQILEILAEGEVSGCATDTLFRAVKQVMKALSIPLLPTDQVLIIDNGNTFLKNFYEIIKSYREGQWKPSWRVVEMGADGVSEKPVEESSLRIHLS